MKRRFRILSSSNGFTIIQVLVGAFVASIVSLGVAQMAINSKIQTRKITLLNTLKEQKIRIEYLLRDQPSFDQTINGALNANELFISLRGSSLTTEQDYATSATKLVIYDSSGAVIYNMLSRYSAGLPASANGLTEKGNPCSTFNANPGSGNDDCPISYRILMGADCPGAATTCTEPQLKIVARLIFNPSSSGYSQLNKFRKIIPTSSTTTDSIANSIIDGRYDAVVKRTASSISRSFRLVAYMANVGGTGAGSCPTTFPAWGVSHPLLASAGWTLDYDPHGLVSIGTVVNSGIIRLNETGYYRCSATAPAYGVGGFSVRLIKVGPSQVAIASSVAPSNGEGVARLETSFNWTLLTDTIDFQEQCDTTSSTWDLGVAKAPYGGSIPILTLACSKMDNAF